MAQVAKRMLPALPTPAAAADPYLAAREDDLECCLITLRECLALMRPTKALLKQIAMIDRALGMNT